MLHAPSPSSGSSSVTTAPSSFDEEAQLSKRRKDLRKDREIQGLRHELATLLRRPIAPKGSSRRFIANGSNPQGGGVLVDSGSAKITRTRFTATCALGDNGRGGGIAAEGGGAVVVLNSSWSAPPVN